MEISFTMKERSETEGQKGNAHNRQMQISFTMKERNETVECQKDKKQMPITDRLLVFKHVTI